MTVDDNPQISQEDRRTAWPFFAAVVVVGVILAAILAVTLSSPDSSEADRVVRAAQTFVAAHNGDADQRRDAECPGFDEARSPLAAWAGQRVALVSATSPQIKGDTATVTVTTRLDRPNSAERNAVWTVAKTGAGWRVCD
jgi:hypothetical protein